jgi:hypothetical protein
VTITPTDVAEITRLQVELLSLGPIVASARDLAEACRWQRHATCEAEEGDALTAVDRAIEAVCAAVDRQGGSDPPAAAAEDVAAFLAMDAPGDEAAS